LKSSHSLFFVTISAACRNPRTFLGNLEYDKIPPQIFLSLICQEDFIMLCHFIDAPQLHFFLSANTPQGFVSRFDQLENVGDNWDACLLKGGPGTGKSTLMKAVEKAMVQQQLSAPEQIHCSSDPHSLDALIARDCRWYIADATAPHTAEPRFPGACERLIALGDCWDENVLNQQREEIIRLTRLNLASYERARRFLTASGSLITNLYRIWTTDSDNTDSSIRHGSGYCGNCIFHKHIAASINV